MGNVLGEESSVSDQPNRRNASVSGHLVCLCDLADVILIGFRIISASIFVAERSDNRGERGQVGGWGPVASW